MSSTQQILILGSGAVAGPCVDYLLRNPRNKLVIGCRTLQKAQELAAGRANIEAIRLDVAYLSQLDRRVAASDLVISLVPYAHHADVVRAAIRGKTNVVTTSYTSPALRELEGEIKTAGITVLNEVGVDPGVDHLYAIKMIADVHAKGGKIRQFHSYCGGLALPEFSDNPLRFKFSWSPRGALLSQYNAARFLQDGKVVHISRDDLMDHARPRFVADGYSFVAYPNRDSVPFRDFYGIPEAHTVVRGSLRYEGNPELFRALVKLGWLDTSRKDFLREKGSSSLTWAQLQTRLIDAAAPDERSIITRIDELCTFRDDDERHRIISGLRWMGLFSDDLVDEPKETPIDTLCGRLEKIMSFREGEQDLVMLQHTFVVEWPAPPAQGESGTGNGNNNGGNTETFTSTLALKGEPGPQGYSAMSKSVGVTCGVATQLLLDSHPAFTRPGLLAPYVPEICTPIRLLVEKEGISMVEEKIGSTFS